MKKLIYIFVVLAVTISINAQWVQTSTGMQVVLSMTNSGNSIFAGSEGSYPLYRSTNNGTNWTIMNLPLTATQALTVSGTSVFAGTQGGIFRSMDNGESWIRIESTFYVLSLATIGSNIFVGTDNSGAVLRSTNNGESWTQVISGLNANAIGYTFAVNGTDIFVGTQNGVYRSTNYGTNWTHLGLSSYTIRSLAIIGSNIFAGHMYGIFRSTNYGINWTSENTGLTNTEVQCFATSGTNIFVGSYNNSGGGVYLSTNNGSNWFEINQGFTTIPSVHSFLILNNTIYAGTNNQSIWKRPLSEVIGINNISSEISSSYSLSQNYPNPFNPTTRIRFEMPKTENVKITVFDALGSELETIVNQTVTPGIYETEWDGSKYPSGMYFYKIICGNYTETKKMVLVK